MNRSDFIKVLVEPWNIKNLNPQDIKSIIVQYPYFQTAHIIYTAYLNQVNDILLHEQLKVAAAHINDRSLLYWLLYGQKQKSEELQKNSSTLKTEFSEVPDIVETTVDEGKSKLEETIPEVSTPQKGILPTVEKASIEEDHEAKVANQLAEDMNAIKESNTLKIEPDEKSPKGPPHSITYDQSEPYLSELILKTVSTYKTYQPQKTEDNGETIGKQEISSKNFSIIDKFIKEEPRISIPKRDFFNPVNMAENSCFDKEDIVSETLASIYLSQGMYEKSLKVYKKLILVYPEKSSYFAAQIENLELKIKK
jgi:hypothetical protein